MAVTRVRERWQGADGQYSYTYIPSDTQKRTFLVYTNSLSDSAATVFLSDQLPALGSSHPDANILTVRSLDIEREKESPYLYNVTANYSDAPIKPPQDPNPLTRQAVVTGSVTQYSRTTITDYQGNTELNTAGDPFDPHEIDDVRFGYQIEKNVPDNAVPSWTSTLPNSTNSDPFTIAQIAVTFDTNTIKMSEFKMSDIKTEYVETLNEIVSYRTLAFALAFNPLTWKFKTPSRGYRAINIGGISLDVAPFGAPYRVTETSSRGVPVLVTKPVFLREDGSAIDPTEPLDPSEIYVQEFDDYAPNDFSVLTPFTV